MCVCVCVCVCPHCFPSFSPSPLPPLCPRLSLPQRGEAVGGVLPDQLHRGPDPPGAVHHPQDPGTGTVPYCMTSPRAAP